MRPRLLGDRYRLGPVIGVGGMGAVHRARDERLGRDVAVKVLRAGAAAADCERLRREVEYLGAVQHPNLVAVLDGGSDGADGGFEGIAWFAMELVAGPDLRTLLRERGPLEGEAVRRLLRGVLGALAAMHAAGLVHRDVTPSNILLTADPFARWEAKLTDLGIARRILSVPLTDAGRVVGTAAYLSPEQVVGSEVGPATDVYALALVAVEALTGETPFPGSAVESATSRLLRSPALPADLSPEWRDLLRSATSVDPADRPDVTAFLTAVLALPEDAGVRPDRRPPPAAGSALEAGGRSSGASTASDRTSAMEAAAPGSTAVLPTALQATGVMRAAARTAELVIEPPRRSHSRVAVVVAASAALFAGIAIVGTLTVVGSRVLVGAAVAQDAGTASPQPTPSASSTAQPEEAAQEDPSSVDQAPSGAAAQPDVVAAQADVAPAGPAAGQTGPGAGPAAPEGGPGQAVSGGEGPEAEPGDRAAAAGPAVP